MFSKEASLTNINLFFFFFCGGGGVGVSETISDPCTSFLGFRIHIILPPITCVILM